ncbi:MAG TPA: quinol:electron acceptor oxidoreductase subunit ActD [Geothrix sp.]|nr:quinol:electron acceptor oxidoreductase subunit ActD [Geothrix sp.]
MPTTEHLCRSRFRASFTDPQQLLHAVAWLRAQGHAVLDTYTPFPVHGMDEAMGLRPSRLPRACLAFAAMGLALALGFQTWTSAIDYPLRMGGKPFIALPAFIPVTFELTVLLAGLGAVASFFVVSRMRPRLRVPNLYPGANDDRFIVAAELGVDMQFPTVAGALAGMGAADVCLLVEDRFQREGSFWERPAGPGALLLACLPAFLLVASVPLLNRDFRQRNLIWDGGMGAPLSAQAFDASGVLPGGKVLQSPPAGTLSRQGAPPLAFAPGKAEAERAGRELLNPYQPTQAAFNRGKLVFERVCATCHGREGDNNGSAIVSRGAFAPTVLVSPVVQAMPDGRIFHVATFGGPTKMKGYGDLLSRADRWKVVLYIRELQKAAARPASAGVQP